MKRNNLLSIKKEYPASSQYTSSSSTGSIVHNQLLRTAFTILTLSSLEVGNPNRNPNDKSFDRSWSISTDSSNLTFLPAANSKFKGRVCSPHLVHLSAFALHTPGDNNDRLKTPSSYQQTPSSSPQTPSNTQEPSEEKMIVTTLMSGDMIVPPDFNAGNSQVKVSSHPKGATMTKLKNGEPPMPPPPPKELPLRFLRAGKNDPVEGQRRYDATLEWRKQNGIDTIIREPHPQYWFIKENYPHYYHFRGKKGQPIFYEMPSKVNLKALSERNVGIDELLRHYMIVTEFQWQMLEPDDFAQSIYICDLDGIRMRDFVGDTVDFVKKAISLSGEHYPERGGIIYLINVPSWFKMIWAIVKPLVDKDTLKKVFILRGKKEICKNLQEHIDLKHIPEQFGGTSVPFGESPEQKLLDDFMDHNNKLAKGEKCCGNKDCKFCTWAPVRSY